MNYYRITAYDKQNDQTFIIDSNGMFEKLWQFSSHLLKKGFEIVEASKQENMIDVNLEPINETNNKMFLRAHQIGKPKYINHAVNGKTYRAIKVDNKVYIPNKEK